MGLLSKKDESKKAAEAEQEVKSPDGNETAAAEQEVKNSDAPVVAGLEVTPLRKISKKESDDAPIPVNTGEPMVTVDVKRNIGKFKLAGVWYDLKPGMHKVPKSVCDVLLARGDLK